jgi:NADPH:quinone reductase
MRAIRVERFGGPEVLMPVDVPEPEPGAGQVLINVAVADTLFVETVIRRGQAGDWFDVRPPYVPGGGVAGKVISVGAGVDRSWLGKRVITRTDAGYAERAVAGADGLVEVPDGVAMSEAAALVHDGLTGMVLFEAAAIKPGEWVLVTAAAGGMGTLLVQLAHAAGARVIAAARGARKLDLARNLGADEVVDYSEPRWAERVRELTGGVDVVLDGAGGEVGRAAFEITKPGGRFSAHGAPSGGFAAITPEQAGRRGVTLSGIGDIHAALAEQKNQKRLTEAAVEALAAKRIAPVIGQTFPLEQAAHAHAAIESREVVGKTLLLV